MQTDGNISVSASIAHLYMKDFFFLKMRKRRDVYHRMLNLDSCASVARAARHPSPLCEHGGTFFFPCCLPCKRTGDSHVFHSWKRHRKALLLPEPLSTETFLLGSPQPSVTSLCRCTEHFSVVGSQNISSIF